MTDVSRAFLDESCRLLSQDHVPKIERSVAALTNADVWWRPNETSNSIGNLLLHLRGNVTQWILSGVGGQPDHRQRQREFDERTPVAPRELVAGLRETVTAACDVIRSLPPESLGVSRHIQHYDVTAFEAIYHVVEHFSMHTGQIILIAKQRAGKDLKLWLPPA